MLLWCFHDVCLDVLHSVNLSHILYQQWVKNEWKTMIALMIDRFNIIQRTVTRLDMSSSFIIFISLKLFHLMYRFRVVCSTKCLNICHSFLANEASLPVLSAHRVRFLWKPTAVQHHPHSNLPTHAVEFLPTQPSMCAWCYYSTGWMFHQVPLVISACHKCFIVCDFLWFSLCYK